jgi:hypothetical protein
VGGIAALPGLYAAWIFAFSVWWLRVSDRIKRSATIGIPTKSTGAQGISQDASVTPTPPLHLAFRVEVVCGGGRGRA